MLTLQIIVLSFIATTLLVGFAIVLVGDWVNRNDAPGIFGPCEHIDVLHG